MINIPVVELIPSFLSDEDEEEEQTEGDHQQVERLEHETETERPLEVDAEGNQHSVCNEGTVHPAEPICEGHDQPSDEPEQRAVEHPFGELSPITKREQRAVQQHNERTHWRDNPDYQPASFPQPAFPKSRQKNLLLPLNVIFFHHLT